MSNNPSVIATDPMTALVQVATQSMKEVVLVGSKVDNLTDKMKTQEQLLREMQLGLQKVETTTGITNQSVEAIRNTVSDHEQRLRNQETETARLVASKADYEEFKRNQERQNEKTTDAISELQRTLVRYGALGAVGLLLLQVVISAYVIPWLQSMAK